MPFLHGGALAAVFSPVPTPPTREPDLRAFEPNRGQSGAGVQFLLREAGLGFARDGVLDSDGLRLQFVRSKPDAEGRLSDPRPGVVNHFSGSDASKWVTGVRRFGTARLVEIYPGVDAEYRLSPTSSGPFFVSRPVSIFLRQAAGN